MRRTGSLSILFRRILNWPRWLEGQGSAVVKSPIRRDQLRAAPANIFSCVEVIKRFLGIHARRILTPWQLYSYLKKEAVYG
jgi:hypothetical protein